MNQQSTFNVSDWLKHVRLFVCVVCLCCLFCVVCCVVYLCCLFVCVFCVVCFRRSQYKKRSNVTHFLISMNNKVITTWNSNTHGRTQARTNIRTHERTRTYTRARSRMNEHIQTLTHNVVHALERYIVNFVKFLVYEIYIF